jgi:hypothetical protein
MVECVVTQPLLERCARAGTAEGVVAVVLV